MKSTNEEFLKIIDSNSHFRDLEREFFLLRLRTLNSEILSIRSGQLARSYSVVAATILEFSKKMELVSNSLLETGKKYLNNYSNRLSLLKRQELCSRIKIRKEQEQCNRENEEKQNQQSLNWKEQLEEKFSEKKRINEISQKKLQEKIHTEIELSKRILLEGNFIAVQAMITSTTLEDKLPILKEVSLQFRNSIEKIQIILNQIYESYSEKI